MCSQWPWLELEADSARLIASAESSQELLERELALAEKPALVSPGEIGVGEVGVGELRMQLYEIQGARRNVASVERDIAKGVSFCNSIGFPQSYLSITSPQIVRGLAAHGVGPRRRLTLEWFGDLLPDELVRHYLRGYFDGDGGFSVGYERGKPKPLWSIIGTRHFCGGAHVFLIKTAQTSKTKLYPDRLTKELVNLTYQGRRQVSRIFRLIYDDATIWLPRKRDKAEPYVYTSGLIDEE